MNIHSGTTHKRESVQTIVTKRHQAEDFSIAWTDGSCDPNPGFGGWGYRIERGETSVEGLGGEQNTTNNRMELRAILEALRASDGPIVVRTDSQLCVLCAVGRWKRKNNIDQWRELAELCTQREVLFEWWRGHCGEPGNERADALAGIGRANALQKLGRTTP